MANETKSAAELQLERLLKNYDGTLDTRVLIENLKLVIEGEKKGHGKQ